MNVLGAIQLGLIYALLALGVTITFRVMNTPDLTVDGSFTLGLAVSAMMASNGHPALGIGLAFLCGGLAGAVTGALYTKGGVHPILAGILTMTGLYSINLFVMGASPNVSLIGKATLFTTISGVFAGVDKQVVTLIFLIAACAVCVSALAAFFKTGLGLQIRATGNNHVMVSASSIDGDAMRILAVGIANAFAALAGAVLSQYQGYADINAGSGVIVIGLASVIIGEVLMRRKGLTLALASAVIGSVIYRLIIALALHLDFFPAYMLKLVSAIIVAITLSVPTIRRKMQDAHRKREGRAAC